MTSTVHILDNKSNLAPDFGLKSTRARKEIYDFLSRSDKPQSVDEILDFLQTENCDTNKVTIYRTLDSFVKKGLVSRLEFHEGKYRYELNLSDHHHLICEKCGNVDDISNCLASAFASHTIKDKKFTVLRHTLEFYGICKRCINKD